MSNKSTLATILFVVSIFIVQGFNYQRSSISRTPSKLESSANGKLPNDVIVDIIESISDLEPCKVNEVSCRDLNFF